MVELFIDSQIANKFAKPPNDEYNVFIMWLVKPHNLPPENKPSIMLSDKLIGEYIGGCKMSNAETSIGSIINKMIADKRYRKLSSEDLKLFDRKYISEKLKRGGKQGLRSNKKDWYHFPLVFLSNTKIGFTQDAKFEYDLINFPKLSKGVIIYNCPTKYATPKIQPKVA